MSILIHNERENQEIVIAVPHHSFSGTDKLPTVDNRSADENTGFLGNYIAEKLNCSSIIASNYSFDVNKTRSSDYYQFILKNKPFFLIEIHGHKSTNTPFDIEISSGKLERNHISIEFAEILIESCKKDPVLNHLKISGDFNLIYYQATQSKSITDDRWIALHIELPLELRKEKDNSLPPDKGFRFCDHCISAIEKLYTKRNLIE